MCFHADQYRLSTIIDSDMREFYPDSLFICHFERSREIFFVISEGIAIFAAGKSYTTSSL